jgi:hypothetical protein
MGSLNESHFVEVEESLPKQRNERRSDICVLGSVYLQSVTLSLVWSCLEQGRCLTSVVLRYLLVQSMPTR